jgi:transketolase
MRDAFVGELLGAARSDPSIMLIVGDLGFEVMDDFVRTLPDQYLNAGVAEQNMLGVAAGLATCGNSVFVYSIANFPTMRALEQIRNDICYHDLQVVIVSVGAGFSYGTLGYSHHGVEDISVMRAMPGLQILCPGDSEEAKVAVREALGYRGPTYIRLDRETRSPIQEQCLGLSKARWLRRGSEAVIIGLGSLTRESVAAADALAALGRSVGVLHLPRVKPMDHTWVSALPEGTLVVTVEEHVREAGFGSAVLETIADSGHLLPVVRLGVKNDRLRSIGTQNYLRVQHGLDKASITQSVEEILKAHHGQPRVLFEPES